ncbi:hypothetical protein FHR83_005299 [Actinoplanes campanulatus]|uniref:Uncharacterized protein n=1 Tax=Actinoplanes campanulatus TaxID=113559 RepID=A0A7W5AJV7_9ACTN|nr:hypothetical protein [Actinoplanes campanulatus]MBB3097621.1 hypothetical protein [Actinoplanes campanulatus]
MRDLRQTDAAAAVDAFARLITTFAEVDDDRGDRSDSDEGAACAP